MIHILIIAQGVVREVVRRKDFYLIFVLLLVIIAYAATLSFGGETGFERYFKEIGVTLTYLFSLVITITFAARQIPQEIEAKTLYPILAHPITREEFIIGKFVGVLFVAAASFGLYYLAFVISLALRGAMSTPPLLLVEGFILHMCLLSFFASMTILFSLGLSTTANIGISLIIYFATNWFGANANGYIFLPHPELFDIKEKIVHTWDVLPLWVIAFLVTYAIVYAGIFLSAACAIFERNDL